MAKRRSKQPHTVGRTPGLRKSRVRIGARVPLAFALIALVAAGIVQCVEHTLRERAASRAERELGR